MLFLFLYFFRVGIYVFVRSGLRVRCVFLAFEYPRVLRSSHGPNPTRTELKTQPQDGDNELPYWERQPLMSRTYSRQHTPYNKLQNYRSKNIKTDVFSVSVSIRLIKYKVAAYIWISNFQLRTTLSSQSLKAWIIHTVREVSATTMFTSWQWCKTAIKPNSHFCGLQRQCCYIPAFSVSFLYFPQRRGNKWV